MEATTVVRVAEPDRETSLNVGGKRVGLPAGYPLHWRVGERKGSTVSIIHYQGMEILARPKNNVDDGELLAMSWSRSGYWPQNMDEGADLPLEDSAVRLACISQWKTRIEFEQLRCDACFRFRRDLTGPCCHCGHVRGEHVEKKNFLPTAERIRVVHIGECSQLSRWFRELIDVDGRVYRLYHREGNMYALRVDDEFVLFDRKQGGPYDGAGSNEEILQQTADVFELVASGTKCWFCRTVYPVTQVPSTCFVCDLPVEI